MTTSAQPHRPRRARLDPRLVAEAGSRVTERDRYICHLLWEHRVLTTPQVTQAAFTGARKTERRLATLHTLGVLDRLALRRSWPGSQPYHWILGPIGAAICAIDRGQDPDEVAWRSDAQHKLARSQRLAHTVGTNGIFTSLLATARQKPHQRQLAEWWSERRCASEWGDLVRPDGYGIWVEGERRLPFLLEYDNGTERHARLAGKLPGYAELAAVSGHLTWILFRFPSERRESNARSALAGTRAPVATAVLLEGDDTAGPAWAPLGGVIRRRLIDLGDPDQAWAGQSPNPAGAW